MVRQAWKSAGTGCCARCDRPLHHHEWVRLQPTDKGDTPLCPLRPEVPNPSKVDAALGGVQALLAHLLHERVDTPAPNTPESDALWASVRLATRDGWANPSVELRRLKALVDAAVAERRESTRT